MEENEKARFVSNEMTTFNYKNDKEKHIPSAAYSKDEDWVQEYIMQFGEEPSFF